MGTLSDIQPSGDLDLTDAFTEIAHFPPASAAHCAVEKALLASGISIPMDHRTATIRAYGLHGVFVAVRNAGRWTGGVFVRQTGIRALPGYFLWRIDCLADAIPAHARASVLGYIVDLFRRHRRVVRLNVGLFSRDASIRGEIGRTLSSLGFASAAANMYTRSIAVDLRMSESELLASFSSSARKRLREFARIKVPLSVQSITDISLAPRMNELMRQTVERTGGRFTPVAWEQRIALAQSHPELCRITGIVDGEKSGGEQLLAFVQGCHHGEHAQYSDGASARHLGRLPLMYPLLWDLIRWARAHGATWFDMGGVTVGSFGDGADPLGGISDFKRRFSTNVIDVADEWVLESDSLLARVAIGGNLVLRALRDAVAFGKRTSISLPRATAVS